MRNEKRLLIVIADGEHFRFVTPAEDNSLHGLAAADSILSHRRSASLGTDQPGASMHSGSTAHHGIAPRHDLHRMAKDRFAQLLAELLNTAHAAGAFDCLVLVAPPPILATIRDGLSAGAAAAIIGTLGKDLVKVPDDLLQPHLADWVRPVRRAAGPRTSG